MHCSTRHPIRSVIACGVALSVLSACSGGTNSQTAKVSQKSVEEEVAALNLGDPVYTADSAGKSVGMASIWESNAAAKIQGDVWRAAVGSRGAEGVVVTADPKDPISSLVRGLDTLTSRGVDSVSYFPIDPNAMIAPSERAVAAGIPVIAMEETNWPRATTVIHQNRLIAAKNAADLLCAKHPEGGGIIYGAYGQPQPDLIEHQEFFSKSVADCSGGALTVVGEYQNKTDDIPGGLSNAQAALQQHPDAVAVVAYNDINAAAASRAATNLGVRDKLTIIGYNLAPDGIGYLRDGVIDYSFYFGTGIMGAMVAQWQVDLADGATVPKFVTLWPRCFSLDPPMYWLVTGCRNEESAL